MEKRASENVVFHLWRFFISLRLTFVLLLFIGIGSVIGMSFDQTVTYDDFYRNRDAGFGTYLLSFFELYDTFHSWWFSLAILFLALNLIACSIERLPRIYFDYVRPRPYLTDRRLLGLPLKQQYTVRSMDEADAVIATFLPKPLPKARLLDREGYFFTEVQSLGRFGVYVVHIALLIIMFSSIYATQNGVDGHVLIEEGKNARFITARGSSGVSYTHDLGFYIGCDDFRLKTFVDNSAMEFESDLYISPDRKQKMHEKTVRVNEPLSYAGFTFYQSSYRPVISEKIVEIEVNDHRGYQQRHRVHLKSPILLPSGETLHVDKIYDDFAGLGQALRVVKTSADGESTFFHVFRRYKDFDEVVRADTYSVSFLEEDQQYATGLSVGKVPGISIIFSGFLLFMVGLYLCFFTTPIRYFARREQKGGHVIVWLSAQGYRNPNLVKEAFSKRLSLITKSEHDHA